MFPLILLGEETGRFFVHGHAADEEDGGKCLHGERDNVDLGATREVQERPVVYPEGERDSSGNEELVETGKTSTDTTGSVFGNV